MKKRISAGFYILTATIGEETKTTIEGTIKLLENIETSLEKTSSGFIIKKSIITKSNDGNTPITAKVEIKKDIISRLFTIFSIEPKNIERNGLVVTYTWEKYLNPSESLIVRSTTNYTFPFILIIIIAFVGFLVKIASMKSLSLNKKISFVRTKKGEFALKVNLHIKAKKTLNNLQIIDMLPRMTKLYEKFGLAPDKVDPKTKRLFWHIKHLAKGEKRVISYIIYSKMNIIGRFELPSALAIYEQEGKVKEVLSNRAYFAAEKTD